MTLRFTAIVFLLAFVVTLTPVSAETTPVDVGALPLLGFETPEWMGPTTGILTKGPSWCTNKSSQYCTYAWDFANACCYPTWIATNAYCPRICY